MLRTSACVKKSKPAKEPKRRKVSVSTTLKFQTESYMKPYESIPKVVGLPAPQGDAGPLLRIDEAAKDALLVDEGAQLGADLAAQLKLRTLVYGFYEYNDMWNLLIVIQSNVYAYVYIYIYTYVYVFAARFINLYIYIYIVFIFM